MLISKVKNVIRVGQVFVSKQKYSGNKYVLYKNKLELIYDPNFPTSLKNKKITLVYFFVVNKIIYKIGQSSSKKGIKSCLNFYFNAGQDDPSPNRFTINWLIRKELKKKNKVEVYMIYLDPITLNVPTLFEYKKLDIVMDAKELESICIKQYFDKNKKYPEWNYQESGKRISNTIQTSYNKYRIQRKRSRN